MGAADFPLPDYRHIPGRNERPAEGAFAGVKATAPAVTSSGTAGDNTAWCYGIRLLNEGYFWEAHEVLEQVWLNAPPNSRERRLVQAVIQLANGCLKETMDQPRARLRIADLCRAALEEAYPEGRSTRLMGLEKDVALRAAANLAEGRAPVRLIIECEI
ncbi:DUF309 domain-containing protein [Roseibium aggregatum]|uniref:DUF309 domain-containing protein n=1 Tax=Roseibium aggregatum TaxID=187304 RepID=A0A926P6B8_9HYPH|nr:DUF309 domain-containing protein [Roseibium aggregatum]MBD1548642.1 DUF309 domain-containing protein [Roseibium aggregatum]